MKKYVFDSGKPGPRLLFFGGVHGDEPSGSAAIESLAGQIASGGLVLLRGSVTMVAHCNERARAKGVRYVERNLNRCFIDGLAGDTYEHGVSRELMPLMRTADVFVDLHSTPGKSEPFALAEDEGLPLADRLGFSKVVVGWSALAGSCEEMSGDTEAYARSLGKPAVTFEAGDHLSPDGVANARRAILNALVAYGMSEGAVVPIGPLPRKFVRMESAYVAQTASWSYLLPSVDNFVFVPSGTQIGVDGGQSVYAERDCVLIMPHLKGITPGIEVFYLGTPFDPRDAPTPQSAA